MATKIAILGRAALRGKARTKNAKLWCVLSDPEKVFGAIGVKVKAAIARPIAIVSRLASRVGVVCFVSRMHRLLVDRILQNAILGTSSVRHVV
jgi:hypothetical protein